MKMRPMRQLNKLGLTKTQLSARKLYVLAKIVCSDPVARTLQNRRQCIKLLLGLLGATLLLQPESNAVEDLCRFERKHFSCYNLGTTDDFLMHAFLEMGLSITEKLVTAMTKWSTAMNHFIAVQAKCRGSLRSAEVTW